MRLKTSAPLAKSQPALSTFDLCESVSECLRVLVLVEARPEAGYFREDVGPIASPPAKLRDDRDGIVRVAVV